MILMDLSIISEGILLFIVGCLCLVCCCVQYDYNRRQRLERRLIVTPQEYENYGTLIDIDQNTTITKIQDSIDLECVICLEPFVQNDEIRSLPCAHFFHRKCIDKWLGHRIRCPICVGKLKKDSNQTPLESA
jgi:hypothetical protein